MRATSDNGVVFRVSLANHEVRNWTLNAITRSDMERFRRQNIGSDKFGSTAISFCSNYTKNDYVPLFILPE